MSEWSQAKKIGTLWYKFKQDSTGNWHILCSGDPNSLEYNSVICHDHYWQNNGRWFVQIRRDNQHLIGRDGLIEGIQRQNERGRLELTQAEKQALNLTNTQEVKLTDREINKLADYRADQAYSNAGYGRSNHGVELEGTPSNVLNNLVKQYQVSTKVLNWRDVDNDEVSVPKLRAKALNWRDTKTEPASVPSNSDFQPSIPTRKSKRKTSR